MSDRLRSAILTVLDSLLPRLQYGFVWSYRVVFVSSTPPITIDARAISEDAPMPDISQMLLWPGPSGAVAVPQVGSRIRLAFADGNPAKPMIIGLDPEAPPTLTFLGGAIGSPVARVGDTVTITQTEINTAVMVAGGNPVTLTNPLLCQITSGSATVQATP